MSEWIYAFASVAVIIGGPVLLAWLVTSHAGR